MSDAKETAPAVPLPDDLRNLLGKLKVSADDPLLLVLAWHWQRIDGERDKIKEGTLELKAILDNRLERINGAAKVMDEVLGHLEGLSNVLAKSPSLLSQQFDKELQEHVRTAIAATDHLTAQIHTLTATGGKALRRVRWTTWTAAFLSGFATGTMFLPWIAFHFFSRS